MSSSKRAKSNGGRYTLILTGQRRQRRRRVMVKGHDRWLSDDLFEAVCELAYAKAKGRGFVALPRQVVRLIRRAVGEPPYASGVPSLIESVAKGQYVLMAIRRETALDRSFLEQPAKELPPRYRGRLLRRAYRAVKLG